MDILRRGVKMWIGNIHVNMTKGDYIFSAWEKDDYKKCQKKIHELRCNRYRLVGVTHDYLNKIGRAHV